VVVVAAAGAIPERVKHAIVVGLARVRAERRVRVRRSTSRPGLK